MRPLAIIGLVLALAGCQVSDGPLAVDPAFRDIAVQRMRFAVEAVCLNNTSRSAQDRAARNLGFPIRQRERGETVYINPGTLTFLRVGPVDSQTFDKAEGGRGTVRAGSGCSVGSPAVGVRTANRIVGEILAPRLVDGSETLSAPLGAGTNSAGGLGFFFDDLAVTMPLADTIFTDPETGETTTFVHPVILIVHQ